MRRTSVSSQHQGFTLIELLIVVAIIAILAAIAVPNFLEAQLRAKVGRTKSDMRTLSMAVEAYSIDTNGKYPILNGYVHTSYDPQYNRGGIFLAWGLTTPVAYLTTVAMPDPFVKNKVVNVFGETTASTTPGSNGAESHTYHYINVPLARMQLSKLPMDERPKYFLISYGPDYAKGPFPVYVGVGIGRADAWMGDYATVPEKLVPGFTFADWLYDPSNGTISGGDIIRRP